MNEQIAGRYQVLRKLGAGTMGQVYLAEDTILHRKAALKFLSSQYSSDPDFKARFLREARAAAALNHPNIITIYDAGEHQNRAFIAMEYVEGESLKDWVARQEFSIEAVVNFVIQICEGLGDAHRAGIVHRDLKPANILIDKRGRVKIADFGLARLEGATQLTSEGAVMGTPAYMSPEQVRGMKLDHRSDIFSLGVMLYELLTRRLPFAGENVFELYEAIKNQHPEPLARYKAGISQNFQRIIDKALDKDRETRYQHVDELLADLKRERKLLTVPIFSSAPKGAPPIKPSPKPVPKPPAPPARINRLVLIAGAAIIVLVLTMILFFRPPKEILYSTYRNDGDVLFRQEEYAAAKQKYQDALQEKPGDTYAAEQIKTCEQRMKAAEAERLYAKYIDEADALFNQANFSAAKTKYEAALAQKPGDRYAASRIKACDDGKSEQAKQAERERQYASLIDAADGLFRRGSYPQAKDKYQQALNYIPADKYAAQQIRECDRLAAIAKEEEVPPGMVRIPAGSFLMGSSDGDDDEKPVHEVYVDAFYMDKHEVTVARYQQFLNATNRSSPENWGEQLQAPNHPVVNVSWDDAVAFCEWLSRQRGKPVRLPTEAEWEYAARGGYTGMGGKPKYNYPWGNEESHNQANYSGTEGKDQWSRTAPVGSFPANGYGLFDMAGNVWEWCADWYDKVYYENFRNSPARNPKGPSTGDLRVLRGGSWDVDAGDLRCAYRNRGYPTNRYNNHGFRCVQDVR